MGAVKVNEGHECALTIRGNIDTGTHVHRGMTMWGHIGRQPPTPKERELRMKLCYNLDLGF